MLKKLFFGYQKMFFYINLAKGEYSKVGGFIPETLMIITYLAVRGIDVKAWHIVGFYVALFILASGIGKFLAVIGLARYNNSLSNQHNPEISEILERIKRIENEIKQR